MVNFTILDPKEFETFKYALKTLGKEGLPTFSYALKWAGDYFQGEWTRNIMNCKSPQGWKPYYISAIHQKYTTNSIEIYANKNKFVNFIEDGIVSRDMKKKFMQSNKVKTFKNGKKYLTIFMQKRKRELTNKQVMKKAKDISSYRVTGTKNNGLKKSYTPGTGSVSIENREVTGLKKTGSKKHTGYGVFRIVTANSKGWIYPAIRGSKTFDLTVQQTLTEIKRTVQNAFLKDLKVIERSM